MIAFPQKRMFGLIGAPRAGKDSVAKYLQETRNFATFAFADQIKEEFGISKGDFEIAKISGNAETIRQNLWMFSEEKKKLDPHYFVKKVIELATKQDSSVITDIRTVDEMEAFFSMEGCNIRRVYYITSAQNPFNDDFSNGMLKDSRLSLELISKSIQNNNIKIIHNLNGGLYYFNRYLDNFFVKEDVLDITNYSDNSTIESMVSSYLSQFEFIQR